MQKISYFIPENSGTRLTTPKISSRGKVKVSGGYVLKTFPMGGLAQLGERQVRNVEVEGSSPLSSTTLLLNACLITDPPFRNRRQDHGFLKGSRKTWSFPLDR